MSGSGNIQQAEVAVARKVLLSLRLEQTCWGRSFEGMVENASTASQLRQLTSETYLSTVFDLDFFFCISFEDLQLVQIWAGFCLDTFLTQRTDLRCVVPSVRSKPAFLGKDLPPTPFPVNFLSNIHGNLILIPIYLETFRIFETISSPAPTAAHIQHMPNPDFRSRGSKFRRVIVNWK